MMVTANFRGASCTFEAPKTLHDTKNRAKFSAKRRAVQIPPFKGMSGRMDSRVSATSEAPMEPETPKWAALNGPELASWKASLALVEDRLDVKDKEAEGLLVRAFGWGSQLYWRKQKVEAVPNPDQVLASIEYLDEVLVGNKADLTKVVKGFPECLAIEVDASPPDAGLKYAIEYVKADW
eukprot:CAMPEP_0196598624 /NCGR_PEP_ID=MMETSP1081-20130531/94421_1 /TAXON_ID=36882 /ORGANISM="Pyramimonas amylifera, Strain CCMP720" /LENGTH=179 /DNA_ID=CAMNT_0041924337 /DNA_START=138 /DNA_END=674 /DNA_ORIENTATION=+